MATGITVRSGAKGKTYRAEVWDNARNKRMTKTFPSSAAAKSWRSAMVTKVKAGEAGAFDPTTVEQAAWCLLVAVRDGRALDRSGKPYKASVVRRWESVLQHRVLPEFGKCKLTELRPVHIQEFVDKMVSEGLASNTIKSALLPLRVIYRFAIRYERCANNPTQNLSIGSTETPRDRIADPQEAANLISVLPEPRDRALWATAVYAGLRRGELLALRAENIDFKRRTIRVTESCDASSRQFTTPKTKAGVRTVPVPSVLLEYLLAVRIPAGLIFGRTPQEPEPGTSLRRRARAAWKTAGLEPIGLHECRHTYASYMIAAGANAKTLSTYMGHANIAITLDRYGHLFPGNEAEAADLLDDFLTDRLKASGQ